jgi:GDP-L-fucose synthase
MKILITGGNGFLGKALYNALKDKYEVASVSRKDFDLSSSIDTRIYMRDKHFNVVLHTAVSGGNRLEKDTSRDMDLNLMMYYNLVENRLSYDKLISFGSGAELYMTDQPYGFSKQVIARSIEGIDNFYNIRLFNVFDETEMDTRFIKSCIQRYIDKEDMEIHQYKKMDFFYMEDLLKVVEYYIEHNNLPKTYDCVYEEKKTLLQIAMMINTLSNYKVAISAKSDIGTDYIGEYKPLGLDYIGLEQGIRLTYNKLKCSK